MKSHSTQNQSKLAKELKEMGVEVKTENKTKKQVKEVFEKKINKGENWKTPNKSYSDIENSPMNRSHRKSLIYI